MPTAPGVYIKEVSSGVHTITGVSTSLTAFVGTAMRGPVNVATRIQSFAEYNTHFGGVDPSSEMSYAVMQFFLNGGSDAYVIRVAPNAATASLTIKDKNGANSLLFTALDGGNAGNGIAVAIDYLTADPNRFAVTVTGVPDANGNSAVEQYGGLSMNSLDAKYIERIINAASNLVAVKRLSSAFGKGTSTNKGPAVLALTGSANQISVSVDGGAPVLITLGTANVLTGIVTAINGALGSSATAVAPASPPAPLNTIVITSASTSDHSSVVVLPGPAAALLGFGPANGGLEADGSSDTRPVQSPNAGSLKGSGKVATLNNHASGTIALALDGARAVNVPITLAMAVAVQADCDALAQRIQTAVRSFRPTVPAFSRFTATGLLNGTNVDFVLTSGTRGANSGVVVNNAGADTLAADLGLVSPPAVLTPGVAQLLVGGSEVALSGANTYTTFVPSPASKAGIYALETVDLFNILCLPGITDASTLQDAAAYCESRRSFLIVDPPTGQKPTDIETLVTGPTLPKSDHAAIYYPYVQIGDPLTGGLRLSAPSGTMAGIYARTDGTRGVWKAPAGTDASLKGVQQLEYRMTEGENGIINPVGANAIRQISPYGNICWGARTLRGGDDFASEYKYVPIRRLALFIEESLYRGTQWVVFEPNDEPLWGQIRLNVGAFMNTLFRQGAFEGASPRDAYFVKCDHETTTQADIDRGVVNIIVGFAPLKPAEFVIISITQIAGQLAA
jgi:phage tail sheath protein FI